MQAETPPNMAKQDAGVQGNFDVKLLKKGASFTSSTRIWKYVEWVNGGWPASVAVIVAVPTPVAVTRPELSTLATAASLDA